MSRFFKKKRLQFNAISTMVQAADARFAKSARVPEEEWTNFKRVNNLRVKWMKRNAA